MAKNYDESAVIMAKLKTMDADELRTFLRTDFHKVKHTESFQILIVRLIGAEANAKYFQSSFESLHGVIDKLKEANRSYSDTLAEKERELLKWTEAFKIMSDGFLATKADLGIALKWIEDNCSPKTLEEVKRNFVEPDPKLKNVASWAFEDPEKVTPYKKDGASGTFQFVDNEDPSKNVLERTYKKKIEDITVGDLIEIFSDCDNPGEDNCPLVWEKIFCLREPLEAIRDKEVTFIKRKTGPIVND